VLIELRDTAFEPYEELYRYQSERLGQAGKYGATCAFVGTMRDFNEGDAVRRMTLEHYPGMTEKHLARIVEETGRRWDFLDALVIHRVGDILPDQPIVLVAVWSSHRGTAFDACRYIMEELKQRAPFWKKENLEQGERWVEKNTEGY
jgi:molybdopterin synthase catalytic subunit